MARETKKGGYSKNCNPLNFMVRLERFERPTYGFVVRCSIQLSYKRIKNKSYSAPSEIDQPFFADFCTYPPYLQFLFYPIAPF